jgi:hypothetical protein
MVLTRARYEALFCCPGQAPRISTNSAGIG